VPLVGKHLTGISVGVAVAVAVGVALGVADAVAVAVEVCVTLGVLVAVAALVGSRPSRMTCGKNTGVASALAARGADGCHARMPSRIRASKAKKARRGAGLGMALASLRP